MKRLLIAAAVMASTGIAHARIESRIEAELMVAAWLVANKCPDIEANNPGIITALNSVRLTIDDFAMGQAGESLMTQVRLLEKDLATNCPLIKSAYGPFGTKQPGVVRLK